MVQAFINPEAALGALTPKAKIVTEVVADLGPSGPHAGEPLQATETALAWIPNEWVPEPKPHYVEYLDELWPEFDDPEERTAKRLTSLLKEVADEALRVFKLKQQVWQDMPFYKVEDSERERFDKEFTAYLQRLNDYQLVLDALEPESTDTEAVYVGLVKRRVGAGPVPDAIMHMYFADQLGILSDHVDEMGKGFVGRVMTGLETVDTAIDTAAEEASEAAAKASEAIRKSLEDASGSLRERAQTAMLWVGGILFGTVLLGGTVLVAVAAARGDDA